MNLIEFLGGLMSWNTPI